MRPPKSVNSWPICFFPVARPHFGKNTCASSAKSSRMLAPLEVTPLLSKAFRYSRATDLRCSSVMLCLVIAIVFCFAFLQDGGLYHSARISGQWRVREFGQRYGI